MTAIEEDEIFIQIYLDSENVEWIGIRGIGGNRRLESHVERDPEDALWNASVDALEALVLAHACAGVDVGSHAYQVGLQTVFQRLWNGE